MTYQPPQIIDEVLTKLEPKKPPTEAEIKKIAAKLPRRARLAFASELRRGATVKEASQAAMKAFNR